MLIPTEQLTKPDFCSILLIGPPKTGKTYSLATLRNVLVKRKLPTKIAFFDMDDDGSETFLRLARAGGWIEDVELHRFDSPNKRIKVAIQPNRTTNPAMEFIGEFNALFDRIDNRTGTWSRDPIGAVVIDSVTGLQDRFEDFVFSTRQREIGEDGQRAITFNDWRLLAEKIIETYQCAKSLPCYFVLTAHVELRQEVIKGANASGTDAQTTGKMYEVPFVTGVLRDRIAKDFSVVLYSTPDFKWVTRPSESARIRSAGTRGKDNLPAIVNQDFSLVLDI